jgi:hypothetical protein
MKLAGTFKYPWGAGSESDGTALGYHTESEAQAHCERMNAMRTTWPQGWNTQHWPTMPAPWNVINFGEAGHADHTR